METKLELRAVEVGVDAEQFTPRYSVLSVGFALSSEDALLIQRAFGEDAEESEELCLVRSPSQECVYEPFVRVHLARKCLEILLTSEAAQEFGAKAISISFSLQEPQFVQVKEAMANAFTGRGFYADGEYEA